MNTITRFAAVLFASILMSLSGIAFAPAMATAQETVDSYNEGDCDVTQDADCVDEDLQTENEGLRLDGQRQMEPGRNGCPTLDWVRENVNIEMIDAGDPLTTIEHSDGCLFIAESYGNGFEFTCPDGMYCTADRGSRNVSIVGDGTRFRGGERVSFYGVETYDGKCNYLLHELTYAELYNLEIVAFGDDFDGCAGVSIDDETNVVDLDDVTNGAANNGSTNDGDVNACPSSAAEAADLLGGSADRWERLDDDSWKLVKGDEVSLSYPGYGTFDHWQGEGVTTNIEADEATFNCS